jgi:hypothetical protein
LWQFCYDSYSHLTLDLVGSLAFILQAWQGKVQVGTCCHERLLDIVRDRSSCAEITHAPAYGESGGVDIPAEESKE